jgi:hypothetical protein
MPQRIYTVYLQGGASFSIRAARFEVKKDGVVFFDADEKPLEDTYIDPSAVIAVIPPAPASSRGVFPSTA